MSTHIFKVKVECEDSAEYEQAVMAIGGIGEILDEESDFDGS